MHPKWLERHMRHARDALAGLERGDDSWACYNARIAVEALLKGLLGYPPYNALRYATLTSLLARVLGNVPECARILEFGGSARECVKCMEVLIDEVSRASMLA